MGKVGEEAGKLHDFDPPYQTAENYRTLMNEEGSFTFWTKTAMIENYV
jgi:hypothetical protein